jgi:aminoglycoside 2''-phosphotransferase
LDAEGARRLVRELSPLAAGAVEPLGASTDSAAFRVGEWVVRFPLVPEAQRTLSTELALLSALAPRLPVAVPRPEHVGSRDGELVFSAYRALEGEPLSDATLDTLAPPARARALDELAALLDAIHAFPVDRARAVGVSFELLHGAYHAAQEGLVGELSGSLTPAERAAIARQRRAFESVQPRPFAPVLLHADIKPTHLLHDPATGSLTGLIDWGDVSLGHPEFDLAIIAAFCGPQTLQGLLERLDDAAAARASASIPFLLTVRWLQDALYIKDRGGRPSLRRLREHLEPRRR